MRKLIHLALAASMLFVVAGGAEAGKARTATGEYNTIIIDDNPEGIAAGHISNVVTFDVKAGERFVSLSIDDQAVESVRAVVSQDYDGDGTDEFSMEICTETSKPIRIKPSYDLDVSTQEGTCGGTPSAPTFGTVTATFTK